MFLKWLFSFILRERESGREREGDRESQAGFMLSVQAEPDMGLDPMNCEIMTWAEMEGLTLNWLSHPGAPESFQF